MLALVRSREPLVQSQECLTASASAMQQLKVLPSEQKLILPDTDSTALIPGLPEDVAKACLALVPRSHFPAMGAVSRSWMAFVGSRELVSVRKEVGRLEEWLYVLTEQPGSGGGRRSRCWEVLGCLDRRKRVLPPMPGPAKAGFGVAVLHGKLLVMAGYAANHGKDSVSSEVFQYDACLNRWAALASMNIARRDFACAEVKGVVYVAGGFGPSGDVLSSVEAYDPDENRWTPVESLRRPRWGCFGFGFGFGSGDGDGKLYVMGGRSSFSIGHSRSVDAYDPGRRAWEEVKRSGCVTMVTSHAVVGGRLFCVEWRSQRTVAAFSPADGGSWQRIPVPLAGSSSARFCLGALRGKVLLLALEEEDGEAGCQTLMYDPEAPEGSEWEWQTSPDLKPSGLCVCSVTIQV